MKPNIIHKFYTLYKALTNKTNDLLKMFWLLTTPRFPCALLSNCDVKLIEITMDLRNRLFSDKLYLNVS